MLFSHPVRRSAVAAIFRRSFSTSFRLLSTIPVLQPWRTHLPTPNDPASPLIHTFYHSPTSTWTFLVADPLSKTALIIDPALDYDPSSGVVDTKEVEGLNEFVKERGYTVERIVETHVHADHLTGARVWKKLVSPSPSLCIGKRVVDVQALLGPNYGIPFASFKDAFDVLLDDGEVFQLGSLECTVLHLPGHTPDAIGIQCGDCIFAGDSIFLPDVGSARTDFPGGSSSSLFASTRALLLSLPPTTRIFSGHDYPPSPSSSSSSPSQPKRDQSCFSTVEAQRLSNLHLHDGVDSEGFTKMRNERDGTLGVPRLFHASLQVNLRGGRLPEMEQGGRRWMRVPVGVKGVEF